MGAQEGQAEDCLLTLSFLSESRQAEKRYDIPTKQLGKNMFVSQSRTLETSVFQAAPAPHRETSSPRYDSIEAAASDRNVV